ncbi:MAG: hypothetical protein JO368_10335, partial [Acidimicrobiales bacterium]|nr:hypothetical protein [Acidimicrobiales bacterium]
GAATGNGLVNIATNVTVDSGGSFTVSAPDTQITQGGSTVESTSGTVQVTATGRLYVQGSATLTSQGTTGFTVGNGVVPPLGTILDSAGFPGSLTIGGTLSVNTVGVPAQTTVISDPSGYGGSFTSFSYGPEYYTVQYLPTTVQVTPGTPFSASSTAFSAAEGEAVTPQTASFNTNSEPGTYTATVDYGDGSGPHAGTVNLSGSSGTVSGPAHTYTAPGTYTVTTTISTTAGTTIPVSESVTVTGPTITGFSKTTVAPGKALATTVSGTNFDGTGAPSGFTTSDPAHLTVTSVTFKAATKKKPAEYKVKLKAAKGSPAEQVSITLTQTGAEAGVVTASNAITIS